MGKIADAIDQELVEEKEEVSEEVVDEVSEDDIEGTETEETDEGEQDDKGSEDTPSLPWDDDEEEHDGEDKVPLKTFLKQKVKLKDLRSEKDSEIEELKKENELLRSSVNTSADDSVLIRPKLSDFETDDEYDKAMDEYEIAREERLARRLLQKNTQNEQQEKLIRRVETEVNNHWERAEEFVGKHNISADVYRNADLKVRDAVKAVVPNGGSNTVDYFISNIGSGSEKVIMYLGTKDAELAKLQSLLIEDPNGHKASTFLGEIKAKINLNIKSNKKSRAPKPTKTVNGNTVPSGQSSALKKRYDEAHKKGDMNAVFKAKREAEAKGIDVSKW